jgi:hypothetical protein
VVDKLVERRLPMMNKIKSLLVALSIVGMSLTATGSYACPNCPHHKSGKCDCAKKGGKCECAKKGGKCDCAKKTVAGPKK